MHRNLAMSLLATCCLATLAACTSPQPAFRSPSRLEPSSQPAGTSLATQNTSSRAYKGHQSDKDVNAFVAAYPALRGTRLDDCQTCHTGGTFTVGKGGKTITEHKNPCDFCHLIQHPSKDFQQVQPKSFAETLNPYGRDYARGGRNEAALRAIAKIDSDGDGYDNDKEIISLKYPGDVQSKPGQSAAPMKTLTMDQLKAMPRTTLFLLANLSKHRDFYATYTGVKVRDLLTAVGVNPADPAIQGITVVAPDGYTKDFPADKVSKPFAPGLFYVGLDTKTLGESCGYVQYPDTLPKGLSDGAPIPGEPWLILGYEREGRLLEPSKLDVRGGKTDGEGPFRMIVPQASPSKPDRGSPQSPSECKDGNDFDGSKDHNAGDMVRGVVAIRINPMPPGYEDFDSKNGGWAYVSSGTLIVYGYGIR